MSRVTWFLGCWLAACGGTAVVDGTNNGGAGGSGASTPTTTSTTSTTSNPTCDDHDDCPAGLCIFSTGQCAAACGDFCSPCGAGLVCDECATSDCPTCKDCTAACVAADGLCDDHDDCGELEVCIYGEQRCAPTCDSPNCADPNMVCVECVTSSCPCCDDCGSACFEL